MGLKVLSSVDNFIYTRKKFLERARQSVIAEAEAEAEP